MNIALIVPGGVDRSGTERVTPALLWLIERIARRHKLHVFALRQEKDPGQWTLLGATVHNIGTAEGRRRRFLSTFAEQHRATPFHVIHAFGGGPGVHAAAVASRHRVPLLLQLTGGELVSLPQIGYGTWRTARDRTALTLAARVARIVTVASEPMRQLAASRGIRAEVITLGVSLAAWPPSPPRARDLNAPARMVQIADINPVKDHETTLEAMAILRTKGVAFQLDLAGIDTLDGEIQRMIAERGLDDAVRWHGRVGLDALRKIVERAHIAVISSQHEAGPLAVLEAAVAGVPTVGTAVGHIAEWAPVAAVAVPCGDGDALAAGILSLLRQEPVRMGMAVEAQRRAVTHDADYTADRYTDLYAQIVR